MSTSTWTGADNNSDWADSGNWSPAGIPDASSDVVITTGAPVVSAPIGTVNSITDSAELLFETAGTNTVATFVDNAGSLDVDATPSGSDEVTAASLSNTGSISLAGSGANQALLDVTTGVAGFGTAGVLSGAVGLTGDSAIEFTSGRITSLAASAQLHLDGDDAFLEDSTALGSNSALTGLASIGAGVFSGSTTRPWCRRPACSPITDTSVSTSSAATGDRA